ncbi:Phage protein [Escherichia phage Gluttony_ev152]|uniref:Phage protein n=1 Tax=Escherichia phage Gluttony_ev152 TaxID=2742948 RepID=A0A653FV38_9CAUD|nr:Phage protein [Escherichia phage Gluttony_ev152]VUF53834.1 Phage protein [Escherichia phage Gluttony_ev152]
MRLTKDIKNQILANILRDHEIATEAKSIMMDSRDLAYAITMDCMPKGIRTFAALREHIQLIHDDKSQMYGVSVYTNKATYYYNHDRPKGIDRVYDATFEINAGGNVRTLSLSGDGLRYRVHRGYWEYKYMNKLSPDLGDIVPGYEEVMLASVCELDEDGKALPIYKPRCRADFPADHDFCKRLDRNDKARRELRAKYDAFKLTVTGVLDMHNTDKKLIKAWPEVEQFIPYPDKPKSTAVALDVKTLNEICGIPR